MKYSSVFEIIGPVMIGPSSSHTAGAVKIGRLARKLFGVKPEKADIHFYGSFAQTYRGHATDVSVVGGILNFKTDDTRIRNSLEHAKEEGVEIVFHTEKKQPEHPNTVRIVMQNGDKKMEVVGVSVGGGAVQITKMDNFDINITGESETCLIKHLNVYGSIASITEKLADEEINISSMNLSKTEKGGVALISLETDQRIPKVVIDEIKKNKNILEVTVIDI